MTPISDCVQAIRERLLSQESQLIEAGQRVVLVIATDGLPTTAQSGSSTRSDKDRLARLLRCGTPQHGL